MVSRDHGPIRKAQYVCRLLSSLSMVGRVLPDAWCVALHPAADKLPIETAQSRLKEPSRLKTKQDVMQALYCDTGIEQGHHACYWTSVLRCCHHLACCAAGTSANCQAHPGSWAPPLYRHSK